MYYKLKSCDRRYACWPVLLDDLEAMRVLLDDLEAMRLARHSRRSILSHVAQRFTSWTSH